MSDIEITCPDCQTPFMFTDSEQAFYQEKGFTPPKRCKTCRQARKEAKGGVGAASGSGERRAYSGGGGGGRSGGGGGGQRDQREFHDVTCSECGTQTQVPFKPRGDAPVYCRDCFKSRKSR